jgi:hypothetical protein
LYPRRLADEKLIRASIYTAGALNVMTPALFIAGVLTFVWPHLRGTGALVTLAVFYGASSGAFVGLISEPMVALGDMTDVGRRTGMYLTILSLGAVVGPPISGAINRNTGSYSIGGVYAGEFFNLSSQLLRGRFGC